MREKDELDDLLDAALSTYADPGPDSGLDQRILARIAVAQHSAESTQVPRRRWLPWAIALPAAACLLFLVFSGPKPTKTPSGPATNSSSGSAKSAARPSQPSPVLTAHSEPSPVSHSPASRIDKPATMNAQSHSAILMPKSARLPKLDVFPTPQPLSPQERALVVFATRTPEGQRKSVIEAQKQADAPLRIEAINIPPLEPPSQGTN